MVKKESIKKKKQLRVLHIIVPPIPLPTLPLKTLYYLQGDWDIFFFLTDQNKTVLSKHLIHMLASTVRISIYDI